MVLGSVLYVCCVNYVVVWQRDISMLFLLCGVVQRFICIKCILCGFLTTCHSYDMYTVWCVVSVSYLGFVSCVVVSQVIICMLCVLCFFVALFHRYDKFNVWWCGCV